MNDKTTRGFLLLVILLISACHPVREQAIQTTLPELDAAALEKTAIFRVTAEAPQPTVVVSVPTIVDEVLAPAETAFPTGTPGSVELPVTPTPALPCNWVQAGNPIDISVPDGSVMLPGQEFIKTWRIINAGSCKWTMLYKYSYYSGNPMGAHQENRLTTEVLPGQAVDISVPFVAPLKPGEYLSSWMMQDEEGSYFGMGMNADVPFYVKINVSEAPATDTKNP